MGTRKGLAFVTVGCCVGLFLVLSMIYFSSYKSSFSERLNEFPFLGKKSAPIEVLLIEDFQCKNCRAFSRKVIPKLQSVYINSGKVRFTLVPVSFLVGSQMIGNATLEVYRQNPKYFFSYLKAVLDHEGKVKKSDLIRFAQRIRGIDLQQLESCIRVGCHNQQLAKNLVWARKVMGASFRTPALFVNGDMGSTYSFEAIQYQIELNLGGK